MKRIASFLIALSLSSCTAFVPNTLLQAQRLSPLTADPAAVALRLELPDGLGVTPDSARIILALTDQGVTRQEEFILNERAGVFSVAADDIAPMRQFQQDSLAAKETRPDDVKGSLSLTLGPCRIGNGPTPNAPVSAGLRMEPDGDFLPLINNGPISAVVTTTDIATWPPCPQ